MENNNQRNRKLASARQNRSKDMNSCFITDVKLHAKAENKLGTTQVVAKNETLSNI